MSEWGFHQYGELNALWPKREDGSPVPPVFLAHLPESQLEAEMAVNLLSAYGIPAVCEYPNDGVFGKIILGLSGAGADIFVPETMLEDARNIISSDIQEDSHLDF